MQRLESATSMVYVSTAHSRDAGPLGESELVDQALQLLRGAV